MKLKKSNIKLTEETKVQIIEQWRTSELNSIPKIAKEFGVSEYKVHTVINNYLSSKAIK
ncbi:hypothetical protein [Flavobacterium denitrificans]|uniref:hypothetical protein n=1 Tax=Flavobacterium denitrificans TaxID=281361 RepID=UPI0004274B19|nr:hypothetical protein [Flavobacterium denitrificans]